MRTLAAFLLFGAFLALMFLCEIWGRITGKPGQAIPSYDEDDL